MFWLGNEDERAIEIIQARYSIETKSQAVRLALRVLAQSPHLVIEVPPPPKRGRKKK